MALIKLVFVAAMAGLVVWRFGRPLSKPMATGYLFTVWTATAATVLIWQSAWLGLASILVEGLVIWLVAAQLASRVTRGAA